MRYRILDMFWLNCNNGVRPFHVLAKWMKGVLCVAGNVGVST